MVGELMIVFNDNNFSTTEHRCLDVCNHDAKLFRVMDSEMLNFYAGNHLICVPFGDIYPILITHMPIAH